MRIALTVITIFVSLLAEAQTTLTFKVGGGNSDAAVMSMDTLERFGDLVSYLDSLGYRLQTTPSQDLDLYLVAWECSMTLNSTYKTSRIDGLRFPLDFEKIVAKLANGKKIYADKVRLLRADGTFLSNGEMVFEKVRNG